MRGPKIEKYESQLSELERTWQSIQINLERSAGLEDDIERIESVRERVETRLMDAEAVAVNSEFFYSLEELTGVELVQFSQGSATAGEGLPGTRTGLSHFDAIPFDLSLNGTLPEILEMLDLLGRSRYIIRNDELSLMRPQEGSVENQALLRGRLQCRVLAHQND
ncbi:MAG: hypothetical protein R6V45_03005 [Oceanipulchritudo sp.]